LSVLQSIQAAATTRHIENEKNRALPDLSRREWSMVVPIVAMAIVMGVYPNPFLRPMEPAVNRVIERVTGRQPAQAQASPAAPRSETRASGGAPAAATTSTSGVSRPDAPQGSRP